MMVKIEQADIRKKMECNEEKEGKCKWGKRRKIQEEEWKPNGIMEKE